MAPSIERRLPEELLDQIVSLVLREYLPKLCQVSRLFNRLATPYLYSEVVLKNLVVGGGRGSHVRPLPHKRIIIPRAHLFFTSPFHASLVHRVIVPQGWALREDDHGVKWEEQTWPDDHTGRFSQTLKEHCAKFGVDAEDTEKIYDLVSSGSNEDAIVAFLLFNLPNLRKLDINFGWGEDHADFVDLFKLLASRVSSIDRFPKLPLDVLVTACDGQYPHDPKDFATFFHLSSLCRIYAWYHGNSEGDQDLENGPFAQFKPRSCPVEFIELRRAKINRDNFDLLLNAIVPGSLRTFIYEIGGAWAWCLVDHPAIMRSLARFHETLENLCLSHEDMYPHQFGNDHEKPYPCSFTAFKVLKRLKVAPVYIWGHEGFTHSTQIKDPASKLMLWKALPDSLEELWITRAAGQTSGHPGFEVVDPDVNFPSSLLLPALSLVLAHKAEAFPMLSRISIEFSLKTWQAGWLNKLALFCEAALVKGVTCTIILTHVVEGNERFERNWGWDEDVEWRPCVQNQEPPRLRIVAAEEDKLVEKLGQVKREQIASDETAG